MTKYVYTFGGKTAEGNASMNCSSCLYPLA